jgi:hypothetical protein
MAGLERLSTAARRAVIKILAPAEPILFVTAPNAAEAARAAWPTAGAGALLGFLGAPIAYLSLEASWDALRWGEVAIMPVLFACIALPSCLMALYLGASPWAARQKALDTVILVTDRRFVLLSIRNGIMRELRAAAILGVERGTVERGFGTLQIRHEAISDHEAETTLTGIDDVLEAEGAIRQLARERSTTIIDPVH